MKTKNCGSCNGFQKWRNDKFGGGICDTLDVRTKSDHGHNCVHWKAKKYHRPKKVQIKDVIWDGGGS